MFSVFPSRVLVFVFLLSVQALASELCVTQDGPHTELSLCGSQPFHTTEAEVTDAGLIAVPDSTVLLVLWNEHVPPADPVPHNAISLDGEGESVALVQDASYELKVRYAEFDPLEGTPGVHAALSADASNRLYLVQSAGQPLDDFREGVAALGGKVRSFVPDHGYVVEMDGATHNQVAALSYVRWVGPFHPAYRVERFLCDNLDKGDELFPLQRYNIMVFEPGLGQKNVVAERIKATGGSVNVVPRNGFLLYATLTPQQLVEVVRLNQVAFVSRWHPPEHFLDIARNFSGANFVETEAGYTGQGVVGEVLDLLEKGDEAIMSIRNFGEKSLDELRLKMSEKGYLQDEEEEEEFEEMDEAE